MHETEYPNGLNLVRPGRMVYYQNDERGGFGYYVPAVISVTRQNLEPEAVQHGLIEDLDSALHVHLLVLAPGGVYPERNVPYNRKAKPRTWRLMEN